MNDLNSNNPAAVVNASQGEELDGQILALIGDSQPISTDERRIRERFPICCKLQVTPIAHGDASPADEPSIIVGKDLSMRGICFSHEFPLSHRRVAISLTHPEIGQLHVEAEIAWTRRTPVGLYESGCRLIRKITGHKIRLKT